MIDAAANRILTGTSRHKVRDIALVMLGAGIMAGWMALVCAATILAFAVI